MPDTPALRPPPELLACPRVAEGETIGERVDLLERVA
jgi:hypothetical protein